MSGPSPAGARTGAAPASAGRIASPARRFGGEITLALAGGADPDDLLLRLTRTDANRLVRDAEIPPSDIRFEAGAMRYLGVRVQQGGVETSVLERVERPAEL